MKDYLSFNFYEQIKKLPKFYSKIRYPLAYDHFYRYTFFAKEAMGNVLDVACGSGFGTYLISENVNTKHVVGIDINDAAFEYAKSLELNKITYKKFDLLNNSAKKITDDYNFNTIYCFEIIEHFDAECVVTFLSKIRDFAGIDTKILFSTPNTTVFSPGGKKWLPYHPLEYTEGSFTNLLNNNGFKVTKMYYQRRVDRGFLTLLAKPLFLIMYVLGFRYYNNKIFKLFYAFYVRLELMFSTDKIKSVSCASKYFIAECKKIS